MLESVFPPEVPCVGDLVQITPIQGEPLLNKHYKYFCEEVHVVSRFLATDYDDRKYLQIYVGGTLIREIRFNLEHQTWSIGSDKEKIQVEVKKILE